MRFFVVTIYSPITLLTEPNNSRVSMKGQYSHLIGGSLDYSICSLISSFLSLKWFLHALKPVLEINQQTKTSIIYVSQNTHACMHIHMAGALCHSVS